MLKVNQNIKENKIHYNNTAYLFIYKFLSVQYRITIYANNSSR